MILRSRPFKTRFLKQVTTALAAVSPSNTGGFHSVQSATRTSIWWSFALRILVRPERCAKRKRFFEDRSRDTEIRIRAGIFIHRAGCAFIAPQGNLSRRSCGYRARADRAAESID